MKVRMKLGEDLRKDRQGRSADGAADADLLRAFAYQYQHDVADAHDAREQRAQTYDPRKQGDASEEPRDLSEHLGGVLKIDRLLVVGAIRCRAAMLCRHSWITSWVGSSAYPVSASMSIVRPSPYICCTSSAGMTTVRSGSLKAIIPPRVW